MEFKVGDKVKIRSDLKLNFPYGGWHFIDSFAHLRGKTVTIRGTRVYGTDAYFINESSGFFTEEMFEPVRDTVSIPKPTWRIIIEGDENTSRAKYVVGKNVVKEASANRYHKDKHDPAMAARALIGKMFPEEKEPEKPKYFTGRVVCVECPKEIELTVGKVYEVKDGAMRSDGFLFCESGWVLRGIESVENLNSRFKKGVKFIEFKE